MLKTLAVTGLLVALAGCVVPPGYGYGYAQPGYDYGYAPAYDPMYGGVNIGIWGGGDYRGDRGHWHDGGRGGGPWHGGHGAWPHGGGGHGGHGGGHGGGGHGGR